MQTYKNGVIHRLREYWYLLLMGLFLILRLFFWFSPSHAEKMNPVYLWPAILIAVALLIYSRPLMLPKGFKLLAGLFLWLLFSCCINGDPYLIYNHTFFQYLFTCMIGFFLVIPMLRGGRYEAGFRLLAYVYCLLMLLLALLGLFSALTGIPIHTKLSDSTLYVNSNRLFFFQYHPNEAASAFTIGVMLLLYLALQSRKILMKVLLLLCALILSVVIALTGSRTSMVITAVCMGACAFWIVYSLLARRPGWLRWPAGLATFCVIALLAYQAIVMSIGMVASLTLKIEAAINPVAASEAADSAVIENGAPRAAQTEVVHMYQARQQFQDIGTLNMRLEIWQSGIDYLKEHPKALVFGVPDNIVSRIPTSVGRKESHMHNAYLEMLVMGGIPGLLMYLGFLAVVFRACWRLAFRKGSPLSYRFLAVIPPLIALNGLTEIYPLFSGNVMDMISFAISGAVIALSEKPDAAEPPLPQANQ